MMTTPSRTVIFLAILCMAAYSAFGAPTEVPTIASLPPSNHKDAADSSKEVKATSAAESPLEMEQESGTATSETSLKTSKVCCWF